MAQTLSFNERALHWLRKIPKAPFAFLVFLLLVSCLPLKTQLFELTTHFKLQYFVASACFAALYAVTRAWRWMSAALICVLISGASFIGVYVKPAAATASQRDGVRIRLMLMNVLYRNDDYQRAIRLIEQEQPDLLFFQEFTPDWEKHTQVLRAAYPHGLVDAQVRASGQAALSRLPLSHVRMLDVGNRLSNTIELSVPLNGQTLTVVSAHPPTPLEGFDYRNEQLQRTAQHFGRITTPKILIGDLNVTPWSPYFQEMLAMAGLRNGREGFGILPSWPQWSRLSPLRIPLDHCLVSSQVRVESFRLGSDIGSDHLPIIVDVRIAE